MWIVCQLDISHEISTYFLWKKKIRMSSATNFNFYPSNSADDTLMIFFIFFLENRIWRFMQIVSIGDNLHQMSKPAFWEK